MLVVLEYADSLNNGLAKSVFILIQIKLPRFLTEIFFRTPPMGWNPWAKFGCALDCDKNPNACINEQLFMAQADRMGNQN